MKTITLIAAILIAIAPVNGQILHTKKISKKEAIKIALAEVKGGKVKSSELEKENGKFVWSFDIKVGKEIKEVWVDAYEGKVIKTEVESVAKEKDEEKNEKKHKEKK